MLEQDRKINTGKEKEGTLGIYIHVPFCRSKCPYCDFYSEVLRQGSKATGENLSDCQKDSRKAQFVEALKREIEAFGKGHFSLSDAGEASTGLNSNLSEEQNVISNKPAFSEQRIPIDTIYFGGGTPNLLSEEEFKEVFSSLRKVFRPAESREKVEITCEVNLKTTDFTGLYAMRNLGINRLSVGAQSFDDAVLRKLGRIHKTEDIYRTFDDARRAGFENISIDLMFGIPGQSFEVWQDTCEKAAALNPEHISLYSLEYMEGTRFTKLLEEGKMKETEESEDRRMYHFALDYFKSCGYEQYEISNLCRKGNSGHKEDGFRSRHNMKYWRLKEYAGFGPSAHSLIDGKRYCGADTLDEYLENMHQHTVYEDYGDREDSFERMSEFVFTGLRMNEGISTSEFRDRFGRDFWEVFGDAEKKFQEFVKGGFAEIITVRAAQMNSDPESVNIPESDTAESNVTETDVVERDVAENDVTESDMTETGMKEENVKTPQDDIIRLTEKGFDISNRILCLFV